MWEKIWRYFEIVSYTRAASCMRNEGRYKEAAQMEKEAKKLKQQ